MGAIDYVVHKSRQPTPLLEVFHHITHFCSCWPCNHLFKITFIIATHSYSTFEVVDLLIAKSSLHIKRLVPWASLYITHNIHISIGITFRYWLFYFISTCHNWLTMWKRQAFVILKFQLIYHPHTQWGETGRTK